MPDPRIVPIEPDDVPAVVQLVYDLAEYERQWHPHTELDPDAVDMLKQLRDRGYRIGVLSNTIWSRRRHEEIFARDAVLELFDGAVYTSEVPWTKPHPEAFLAAMRAAGASDPRRCVFVGDRLGSRRRPVRLVELGRESFALVDPRDGPGFNRAVAAHCRDAGFEPRLARDPHGPMAWETAVRMDGCVGLTTRSAAASTARDLRLFELRDEIGFPLQLIRPARPLTALKPVARAFRRLAREMASNGALAPP